MKVLITGADGFLGRNLRQHLAARADVQVAFFNRSDDVAGLPALLDGVALVFHLAGVNRPRDAQEFKRGNVALTQALCGALAGRALAGANSPAVIFTSSTQAANDSPYGQSKRLAESALTELAHCHGVPVHLFRLPNVFGKWCKPNYNSAVATFCHNIARGLPVQVHDPSAPLTLVHVDDVIARFLQIMDGANGAQTKGGFACVTPEYTTTVGAVERQIRNFRQSRDTLVTERVGQGLTRALYATYVSYLPVHDFTYPLKCHGDPRGVFVEFLKTPDAGQFSYFTAHPGVTRGGHYHHSKTEKFLVLTGQARFRFRHIQTGDLNECVTSGDVPEVVETVPGWTHDITNIGQGEMIVMLWANEQFDAAHPDTYSCPL